MKHYQVLLLAALVHVVCADEIDPLVPCKNTTACTNITRLPSSTFCKDGFCICPGLNNELRNCSSILAMPNSNKTTTPLVSRTCKREQECMLKNGYCNTTINQCACNKGFVSSTNRHECLKTAESIGSSCVDDKQCVAFQPDTICKDEKCVCGTGYHNVDNACWRMAGYGKPCTKTQECSHIDGAVCNDKKVCGCDDGQVIGKNETQCLSVAKKFHDSCTDDVQCSTKFAGSVCAKEECQCRERCHFEEELQKCIVNKAHGEDCDDNYQCYQPENENDTTRSKALQCLANVCECADNYNREGDKCVSADNGSGLLESSIGIIFLTTFAMLLSSW